MHRSARVAHVLAPGPVNAGAEHVVLAGAGAQLGALLVSVAAKPGGDAAFVGEARTRALDVERIEAPRRIDAGAMRALRRTLCDRDVDVVHAHGARALLLALAASGARPVVCTLHGFTAHDTRARQLAFIERVLARRAAHTCAVSRPLYDDLIARGHHPARTSVVPNPVRLGAIDPASDVAARDAPPPHGRVRLVSLARLSPEKGIELAVRALALLEPRDAITLDIYGEGSERPRLEALIETLGLAACVRLRGHTSDVRGVLAGADGLVLPSLREGEPLAVLEALACGVPVVASAVGGVPDLVQGTRAGVLVPPGDAGALALALHAFVRALDDHGRAARELGRRVAASRSPEAWAARMDSVYRSCLRGRVRASDGTAHAPERSAA